MNKVKNIIVLSFVLIWLLQCVRASRDKAYFMELPYGIMEMTLEYLDITAYFQFSLVTTSMYRRYYPRMPAVMYPRYYQWLTNSPPHHRFDLLALQRYSTYLQWSLAGNTATETLIHGTTGFQLFTNDPSAPRITVTNYSPASFDEYFSRHRSTFEYRIFRFEEHDIYQSWSLSDPASALPLMYNPVAARLMIDQNPIVMNIDIPAVLLFTNDNNDDLQFENLSEWRCTTIHRYANDEPNTEHVKLIWYSRVRPLSLLIMIFDSEGCLIRLQTGGWEYSVSVFRHSSRRNEYRLTIGKQTTYTLVYAFYYLTLPKQL